MPSNVPTGVTPEMLQAAIESPGQVVSNSPAQHFTPSSSVPIDGYAKKVRPEVRGQEGQGLVTRPNMAANNEKAEAEQQRIREEREAAAAEHAELQAVLNPQKLLAQLNALDRKTRRLERELKALKAEK